MEPEPGEVGAEARLGCSDPEIGHQREPESTPDGRPLDRGHHGRPRREEPHGFVAEMAPRVVANRIGAGCEVGPGTEVAPFRGQHDRAAAELGVQPFDRVAEPFDQALVEEVVRRSPDLDQRYEVVAQRDVHVTEDPELSHRGSPTSDLAMIMRWICPVPSTMSMAFTSRYSFSIR